MIKDIDGTFKSWEDAREGIHNFAFDHLVSKPKGIRMLKDRRTELIEKATITPVEQATLQELNRYIGKIEKTGSQYLLDIKYKNWQRNWGKKWLRLQLMKAKKKGKIPDWAVPIIILITSEGQAMANLAKAAKEIPNYE